MSQFMQPILLFFILQMSYGLSQSPLLTPTSRYVNISTITYNTAPYFNTATTSIAGNSFAFNFAYAKANTNYRLGQCLNSLNHYISISRKISIQVDAGTKLTTGISILIYTNTANKINIVTTRIIILEEGFLGIYFHYFYPTIAASYRSPMTYSMNIDLGVAVVKSTAKIWLGLTSIYLTASSGNTQFGFSLAYSANSNTQVLVVLTALSKQYFFLEYIGFCLFAFSPELLLAAIPSARYTSGVFSGINGDKSTLKWSQIPSIIKSYNAIIGLTGFNYQTQTFCNFQHIITPGVSLSASSTNRWLGLNFSYLIFQFFYCPDETPFLLVAQNLCYDNCPPRYGNNFALLECQACLYDCYECQSDGKCITCNATTDFRQLDAKTGRCIALPGYYNNGSQTVAVACNASKCLTCTAPSVCMSCYPGKYLSGTNCMACVVANCMNCTSTVCITCATYYSYVQPSCVINCSSIVNCSSCSVVNASLVCSNCSGGIPLINNTCSSYCGDGYIFSIQECDDGNNISSDGCSSTCLLQEGFYCAVVSQRSSCSPCVSNCIVCNASSCIECMALYVYLNDSCTPNCSAVEYCSSCQVNSSSLSCLSCQSGCALQADQTCYPICGDGIIITPQVCDDGNINNSDGCAANCTLEVGYFCTLSKTASLCSTCISQCNKCNDSTSCTECNSPYTYVNGSCVLDCSNIQSCEVCYINSTLLTCSSCSLGYQIVGSICNTSCGDSIKIGSYEECDDGNTLDNDGCSSSCTVEIGYFCLENDALNSSCLQCIDNCNQCTNQTQCLTCQDQYTLTSNSTCFIDCSILPNCQSCGVDTTTRELSCSNCSLGYYADESNDCLVEQCGDGFRVVNESCDDGNVQDGDGCSSTCTIEPTYYCEDGNDIFNKSSCFSCIPSCQSCTNSTDCLECSTYFNFSVANQACELDCTVITLCLTCQLVESVVACTGCQIGYVVNASYSCSPSCGDGIRVTEEECDDGNTVNDDGCSSLCLRELKFYCEQIVRPDNLTTSNCTKCLAFCELCSSNPNDCQKCIDLFIYTETNGVITCEYDCQSFSNCRTCNPNECLVCNSGYIVSNSACVPICGDGIVRWEQKCDDNNKIDSDGCSSTCAVEENYECFVEGQGFSVCYLTDLQMSLVSIIKDMSSNSLTISYQLDTFHPAFATQNWTQIFSQTSNLSVAFTTISFDQATNQLLISVSYQESIQDQDLSIELNMPDSAPFNLLPPINITTQLKSHNNLLLETYSQDQYQSSKLFGSLVMVASFLSLIAFFIGFYKGKLIGLQLVAIFQITYLSIITIENLTPMYSSFSYLSYSCGYNVNLMKSSVNIGSRFKLLNLTEPFMNNYNVNIVLVVLPLILSLILYLVNKFRYNLENKTLTKYSDLMKGEYCFNGLMFSGYTITLSAMIEVMSMMKASSSMVYAGIALAAIFIAFMLVFGVLIHKVPHIFGQFTQKFNKESIIQSHYYCFMVLERIIVGVSFGLVFLNPQSAIVMAMIVLQITVIVAKRPYCGERGNVRPILNLTITLLICVMFVVYPMISKTMPEITKYSAYLILALLFCSLPYNIYFYIKSYKQDLQNQKSQGRLLELTQESKLIKQQFAKSNPYANNTLAPISAARYLNASLLNKNNESFNGDAQSPNHFSFGDVKAQLQKIKAFNPIQNNETINHVNTHDYEIEDSILNYEIEDSI